MAFEWDEAQRLWLQGRFEGNARSFEAHHPVAGSSLEIDAVVEGPRPDDFFDFLGERTLFENKAPSHLFGWRDLVEVAARTLLYAGEKRLSPSELDEVQQVVLCSRATRSLRRHFRLADRRAGVLEGFFVSRLVIVEANRLPVEGRTLPLLLLYATGEKLREAIERVVDEDRTEYHGVAMILRNEIFWEVMDMKGRTRGDDTIDLRGALQKIGFGNVIRQMGLRSIIEEVGIEAIVEEVGIEEVVKKVGIEEVVKKVGIEEVVEALKRALGKRRAEAILARVRDESE